MTALSIVQTVCSEIGLPFPTTAVSSTDTQILQIVALANREGKTLTARPTYGWQQLQTQAQFTTIATEVQGALSTIAPGLKYIINNTIWDRTLRRPVFGPLTPQRWQQLKAVNMVGPWAQFRIQGGQIKFLPAPAAGDQCDFEYQSANWCTDSTGATTRSAFLQDTDLCLLDEDLITLGTIWRWKKSKGLEYGEDFNEYERQVMDAIGRDGAKDVISMEGGRYEITPGVLVPSGSWPL